MSQKIVIAIVILFVLGSCTWYEQFKWHECRRVGHAWFYCVMTQNK